jgi:Protein of unknown function (DUF2877)
MQPINALSLAPDARNWLVNSSQARILHVFDRACNLINEHREVLSIVTPQIGNGPFNLVLGKEVCFPEHLSPQSPVAISLTHLTLDDLSIHTLDAKLWNPRPNWEMLHTMRDECVKQLTKLRITTYLNSGGLGTPFAKTTQGYSTSASAQSLISNLHSSLTIADLPSSLNVTQGLAGLGTGLTPSGDDFILGAIYAAWIIHPPEIAKVLADEIANTAVPLTTSLSAAWLRSAGKGEAGILWHEFFDALISANLVHIQEAADRILAVGETSGADAMAGFMGLFIHWGEYCSNL